MVFRVQNFAPDDTNTGVSRGEGGFFNAVGRGVDQTQLMLYSFANAIGEATGIDMLAEFGEEGAERNLRELQENPAQVQAWDDVNGLADFATYIMERVGEQVPMLATVAASGGGALLARAAIGKTLKKQLGEEAFSKFAANRAVALTGGTAARAAQTGALVGGTALNAGETQATFNAEGIDAPFQALFTGAVKGALDAAGLYGAVRGAKLASGASLEQALGQAAMQVGKAVGSESATEAAQALVDRISLKVASGGEIDVFSEEGRQEIIESAIVGGLLGGVINAPISAVEVYKQQTADRRSPDPTQPNVDVEQEFRRAPDPEPQSTLDAQARAINDPTSTRNSLLVTEGGPRPSEGILPDTTQEIETDFGTILTVDPAVADRLRSSPPQTEDVVGEILFGPGTGTRQNSDGETVLQTTDRTGAVVSEVATTRADANQLSIDVANAFRAAPANSTVRARKMLDVLNERQIRIQQEAELTGAPISDRQFSQGIPDIDPSLQPRAAALETDSTPDELAIGSLAFEDVQAALESPQPNSVQQAVSELPAELQEQVLAVTATGSADANARNTVTDTVNRSVKARRGNFRPAPRTAPPAALSIQEIQALAAPGQIVNDYEIGNVVKEAINSFGAQRDAVLDALSGDLPPDAPETQELTALINSRINNARANQQAARSGDLISPQLETESLQQRTTETGEPLPDEDVVFSSQGVPGQPAKGFVSKGLAERFAQRNLPNNGIPTRIVGRQAGNQGGAERFFIEQQLQGDGTNVRNSGSASVFERQEDGRFLPEGAQQVEQTSAQFVKQAALEAQDWAITRAGLPEKLRESARDKKNGLSKVQRSTLFSSARLIETYGTITGTAPGRKEKLEFDTRALTAAGSDILRSSGVSQERTRVEWARDSLAAMLGEMSQNGYKLNISDKIVDNAIVMIPSLYSGDALPVQAKEARKKRLGSGKKRKEFSFADNEFMPEIEKNFPELAQLLQNPPGVPDSSIDISVEDLGVLVQELEPATRATVTPSGQVAELEYDGKSLKLGSGSDVSEIVAAIERHSMSWAYFDEAYKVRTNPDAEHVQQIKEQADSDVKQARANNPGTPNSRKQKKVRAQVRKSTNKAKPNTTPRALRGGRVVEVGRAAGYGDITRSEVNFVHDIMDSLQFNKDLQVDIISTDRISTPADILALAEAGFFTTAQAEQAIAEFKANKSLRGMVLTNGKRATVLVPPLSNRNAESIANRMVTLGHELGHLVLNAGLDSLTPNQRALVEKAYQKQAELYAKRYPSKTQARKEWFADKVAAWAIQTNKPAKSFVDRLAKGVAKALRKVWTKLAKATGNPRFRTEASVAEAINAMRDSRVFERLQEFTPQETIARMQEIEQTPVELGVKVPTFSKIIRMAKRAYDISIVHPAAQFFLTNNGALVEFAPKLARLIQKPAGMFTGEKSITERVADQTRRWRRELRLASQGIFDDRAMSKKRLEQEMDKATQQLARELPDDQLSPLALSLRDYLKRLHGYLKEASPTMGEIENYFPRQYDPFLMAQKRDDLVSLFERFGVENPKQTYLTLMGEAENAHAMSDSLMPSKLAWQRARKLTNPELIKAMVDMGVLNPNPTKTLDTYLAQAVRRAEAERTFGDYVTVSKQKAFELIEQYFGDKPNARDTAVKWGYLRLDQENRSYMWYDPNAKLEEMLVQEVDPKHIDTARELALQSLMPMHSYTLSKSMREWGLKHRTSLGPPSIKKKVQRLAARLASKEDRQAIRLKEERSLAIRNDPEVASLLIKNGKAILTGDERALVKAWRARYKPEIDAAVQQVTRRIRAGLRVRETGSTTPLDKSQKENLTMARAQLDSRLSTTSQTYNVVRRMRMYESFRLLAFSGIASIPEIATSVSRARGEPVVRAALKEVLKFGSWAEVREFAEDFGLIQHELGHALASETFQAQHGTRTKPEEALRQMFKWNGNDAIVNFSRIVSGVIGKHYLLSLARKLEKDPNDVRANRLLKESRIDADTIRRWHADGQLSPEAAMAASPEKFADAEKIAFSIGQFVDESSLVPTDSDRPTTAGHPLGALVWHMKSFMVTMHRRVIMGMAHELGSVYKEADKNTVSGLNQTSMAVVSMLWPYAVAAIGMGLVSEELRRLFQKGETTDGAWIAENPLGYLEKGISRSGVTSAPFQEFMSDPSWNNLMYSAGPTASHANELLTALFTEPGQNSKKQADDMRAIVRSIPGMSQLPSFRAVVYDTFGNEQAQRILVDDDFETF